MCNELADLSLQVTYKPMHKTHIVYIKQQNISGNGKTLSSERHLELIVNADSYDSVCGGSACLITHA